MATPVPYGAPVVVNGSPPVATVCTPASGSPFSIGLSTVTCTATDALRRTDSCTFPVTVVAAPMLSVTKFLAFGDSITRGEDGTSGTTATSLGRFHPAVILPDAQTYPGALQQELDAHYFAQLPTVSNAGCPGEGVTGDDSACSFPTAFARFTSLTSSRFYQAVLIMEGSNDLYQQHDASNLPNTIAGLGQMLGDAKSRGIRPYLATIPPINPLGSRGRMYGSQLVSDLNNRIIALGLSQGVTVVDVNQLFGNSFTLIGPDGLHPTPDGYMQIATLFFNTIMQTLETTTSPVSLTPVNLKRPLLRSR